MSEDDKDYYILECDSAPEKFQFDILETRFEVGRKILNACKSRMLKQYKAMKNDWDYQFWILQKKSRVRSAAFKHLREKENIKNKEKIEDFLR